MVKKNEKGRKRSAAKAGLRTKEEKKVVVENASSESEEEEEVESPLALKQQNKHEDNSDSDADDSDVQAPKQVVSGAKGTVRKVIVLLEEATLEAVRTSNGHYELLNCDDHLGLHKKLNKDPSKSRPDISHQMLLALLDSPLNKAGHMEIYLRTHDNVLVKVSEHLRIPRTFKRFSGLMVQLLHKMKIRAVDGDKTLLKVIKNPINRHLPPNARVFAASVTGTLVNVHDFVPALPDTDPVVFVFGAFAHGHVNVDYAEALLSFSEYPLSGACAISRLLCAFENKWGIV